MDFKFRLIKDGKFVGYEHHRINPGKHAGIFHSVSDSADDYDYCNIHLLPDKYIEHDDKQLWTGLKDCGLWPDSTFDKDGNYTNLKEIYTHDIVEVVSNNVVADGYAYEYSGQRPNEERFVVSRTKAGFTLVRIEWFDLAEEPYSPNRMGFVNNYNFWNAARSLKVVGNTTDNPELLEASK